MYSICGILGEPTENTAEILANMSAAMRRRGPDQSGIFIEGMAALAHNRLAIIDPENGLQPMTRVWEGRKYTIVYNGEIYNCPELTAEIRQYGVEPETYCDTETVLWTYILFGEKCAALLNGIFAFAVYDEAARSVYLARDRFGVKPLFYTWRDGKLLFASEIKALLRYPGIRAEVDARGVWELLFLAPDRLPGSIFRGIEELSPAEQAMWTEGNLRKETYWHLEASECRDSREEAFERTQFLLRDAVRRQMVSDVLLCTLLSGGLDSSVISALAAEYCREHGKVLATYSFEYEGNRENFHSSLFQPQSDDRYAVEMAEYLLTGHQILTVPTAEVVRLLGEAALARDFPGQADIDSSLLYFCRRIKERHTVAMSGECADEIFGGYPWFYRPEMLQKDFFPWVHDPMLRPSLFRPEFARPREGYDYMVGQYHKSLEGCPVLDSDSPDMRTSRLATWLSVHFFMTSLLERKDRMSMASSVEVRVPFADHRILEYVYNVPWTIKSENGVEKALLRGAMAEYLPASVLERKKSPYPKSQNPAYEAAVREELHRRLSRKSAPLAQLLDKKALRSFLSGEEETWFGQLMGRAQLLAWLIQFDVWAEAYHVDFI